MTLVLKLSREADVSALDAVPLWVILAGLCVVYAGASWFGRRQERVPTLDGSMRAPKYLRKPEGWFR